MAQPIDKYKQPGWGHPIKTDRQAERVKERQDLAEKYATLLQLLEQSTDVFCNVSYSEGVVYFTQFEEHKGYRQLFIIMNRDQRDNWKAVLVDVLKLRSNKNIIPVWVNDEVFIIHKGRLETDFYDYLKERKESCGKSTTPCD